MHCPRCGQQQVSEDIKFCSRCGFQLAIVNELLIHGGVLPQLAALQAKTSIFNKKNGVMFSIGWFIVFTMLLTSIWGILDVDVLAGISAVTGVFGALLILIGSLVFLPSSKRFTGLPVIEPSKQQPASLHSNLNAAALPPPQQQSAADYAAPSVGSWRAADTGDLVPGSVIENTTKLLQKDK